MRETQGNWAAPQNVQATTSNTIFSEERLTKMLAVGSQLWRVSQKCTVNKCRYADLSPAFTTASSYQVGHVLLTQEDDTLMGGHFSYTCKCLIQW